MRNAKFGVRNARVWPSFLDGSATRRSFSEGGYHIYLTVLFGFFFALLVPPFQSPDESNHFLRAWQVSEGRFFPESTGTRLGGNLPASLTQVCDSFLFLKNDPTARLHFHTLRQTFGIPLNSENRRFTDFANTAIYAPTAYIPQAAAIAMLRPLGATPLQLLYAARLANLLVWALLVAATLRLMPFMRSILGAMALLPATLCIAASANADVLTNGLCWWLVAALLSAAKSAGFWKQLSAVVVVAANKLIALPLVFLGLVPKYQKWPFAILLAAGVLAALFWGQLAQSWFIPYDNYDSAFRDTQTLNSGVDPARQLVFISENPVYFIKIAAKSLFQALPSMAAHFVGKFGWEKNYLPTGWLVMLGMMLAALTCVEKNPLSVRQRFTGAWVIFLYVGAFSMTMYTLWVAVGAGQLDNWQGRYFLPIAPVIVLVVGQGWLGKWKSKIELFAFIVLVGSNLAMVVEIFGRYYKGG